MDLFILNVDEGDLERVQTPGFSAKKRIVHSERRGKSFLFNLLLLCVQTADMHSFLLQ